MAESYKHTENGAVDVQSPVLIDLSKMIQFPLTDPMQHDRDSSKPAVETLILRSGSEHPFMGNLDRYRTEYMERMGWRTPGRTSDLDHYDDPSMPTHSYVEITKNSSGDEVMLSSMRLTRILDPKECLSFDMVNLNINAELSVEYREAIMKSAEKGELYDLTRLLPASEGVGRNEYFNSVIRLIGCGVRQTAINPDADPIWVYATDRKMHAVLNTLGIINDNLKEADPEREGDTGAKLCLIRPLNALAFVKENNVKHARTLREVVKGIETAGLTTID